MDLCDAMPSRRQGYLCLASMMVSAAADLHNDNKPASLYLHLWTGTVKENELEHVAVSNNSNDWVHHQSNCLSKRTYHSIYCSPWCVCCNEQLDC